MNGATRGTAYRAAVIGVAGVLVVGAAPTIASQSDANGGSTAARPPGQDQSEAEHLANGSGTKRPELQAATIVDITSSDEVGEGQAVGTTVRYTFDEEVVPAAVTGEMSRFHVYKNDGTREADGASWSIVGVAGHVVTVRFSELDTDEEAGLLTLATVDLDAVRNESGLGNPEGDAPLGNGTAAFIAQAAGTTQAPDLLQVAGFGVGSAYDLNASGGEPGADEQGTTSVDYIFDEPAFTKKSTGFELVLTDGSVLVGTAEAVGTPRGKTPSGGPKPGGNGTTTITVLFRNPDGGDTGSGSGGSEDPTLAPSRVARAVVLDNAVADAQQKPGDGATLSAFSNGNALQAAPVSNDGNTQEPDLVSLQLSKNGNEALFTFDQDVTTNGGVVNDVAPGGNPSAASDFRLYKIDGTQVIGTSRTVLSSDRRKVVVTFAAVDAAVNAVGGNVLPGAVFASDSAGNPVLTGSPLATTPVPNENDEEGVPNKSPVDAQAAGATLSPDLVSLAITHGSDAFGNPTGMEATYSFDEDVTSPVNAKFFLHLADGTRLVASACSAQTREDVDHAVICTAFSTTTQPATRATEAELASAVLGIVDDAAVLSRSNSSTAAQSATSTDPARNPEGAEVPGPAHGATTPSPTPPATASPAPRATATSSAGPTPAGFHTLTPARVFDTREAGGAIHEGKDRLVDLRGKGGVPTTGVSAVVLNATVTGVDEGMDLQLFPAGGKPGTRTSNVNATRGATVANMATVPLGDDGKIGLSVSRGSSQVLLDVLGWYGDGTANDAGDGYVPLTPTRRFDSRESSPVMAGDDQVVPLVDPVMGARSAVVVLTAFGAPATADVQLYPFGAQPTRRTSTLNLRRAQAVANLAVVRVDPQGRVAVSVSQGSAHVVLDLLGYYASESPRRFTAVAPTRTYDTRTGTRRLTAGADRSVRLVGSGGIPTSGVSTVLLNVTATRSSHAADLQVFPTGMRPDLRTSNLNVQAGQDVGTLVLATLGQDGNITLSTSNGSMDVILDVVGWVGD